jgi:hypothetical protein
MEIGCQAHRSLGNEFDLGMMISQIEALYEELLDQLKKYSD